METQSPLQIAVLLPCYNEAAAIDAVVKGFQASLPQSKIYVYDNGSSDDTIMIAKAAGAVVRTVLRKGKGNVVRAMFSDIKADVYVLADGDLTYDSSVAPKLIQKLLDEYLDMVVGTRAISEEKSDYRFGHRLGNRFFNKVIASLFGKCYTDVLSGYRVFSHRFVKSFPILSRGFDIEVEMTIHSLELRLPIAEVPTRYASRPENSFSKLSTYRDGIKILSRIVLMLKETKPFMFFLTISLVLAALSLGFAAPLLITFIQTHLVPRIPTAILAASMMLLAFIILACGVVLDSVGRGRRETKLLNYLKISFLLE